MDDSPTMARTMALTLERAGYSVESVQDLAGALERLAASKVKAVVVDNNGKASWAAAVAEKVPRGVPIVALLDSTEGGNTLNGAFVSVRKPFDTTELLDALDRALTGKPGKRRKPGKADALARPTETTSLWTRFTAWLKTLLGLGR